MKQPSSLRCAAAILLALLTAAAAAATPSIPRTTSSSTTTSSSSSPRRSLREVVADPAPYTYGVFNGTTVEAPQGLLAGGDLKLVSCRFVTSEWPVALVACLLCLLACCLAALLPCCLAALLPCFGVKVWLIVGAKMLR